MRNSPIALALLLLASPVLAQTFEEAVEKTGSEIGQALAARRVERAKAAASAAARAETDPCLENAQLDKASFTLALEKLELKLSFKSCTPYYVDEAPHGRLPVSQAIRRYEQAGSDQALVVITARGSDVSQLVLVKGVSHAGSGAVPSAALTQAKPIYLDGKAKLTPIVPAAPVDEDMPDGHDCR